MNSIIDEVRFLFSGRGMPYEKVCLTVAMVISVILSVLLAGNFAYKAKVAVVDLDNSAYSREVITRMNASEYIDVTAVFNMPTDPQDLCYRDANVAVVYLPQGLEKDRYTGSVNNIGVFYDNTNTAQTSNIKAVMNTIVQGDNAIASGDVGSTNDVDAGTIQLAERYLFNPNGSTSNGETLGFLFFFGSMFFTFATIGMVPRLRLTHQLDAILMEGTPWDLILRIIPYGACLIVSFVAGLAVLRVWGDLIFSGNLIAFLILQCMYVMVVGMMSLMFGWTAANPGIASSRMILFIPGGFILGGPTGPVTFFAPWVVFLSHFFPLTWEFHFVRDVISRGAGLGDISKEIGAFLIYVALVAIAFCWRFYRARGTALLAAAKEKRRARNLDRVKKAREGAVLS